MNTEAIAAIEQSPTFATASAVRPTALGAFARTLAAALDGASDAIARADGKAGAVAAGSHDVAGAAIARAKADVALEIVSVAAARISGALNALSQTQV